MYKNTDRKKKEPSIIWLIFFVIYDISALAFMFLPFITKNQTLAIINLIIYVLSSIYGVGKILLEAMKDEKIEKEKIKYLLLLLVLWLAPMILYIAINYVLTAM